MVNANYTTSAAPTLQIACQRDLVITAQGRRYQAMLSEFRRWIYGVI